MLKRIKVRSKLLVLVVPPLVALGAFAAIGVDERLERADFFSREERIAELADAGADLSLAVQVERNRALQVDAGGAVDMESAVASTDAAVDRWLTAAATARADLSGAVVEEIDDLSALLTSARTRRDSDMGVIADQLFRFGRSINSITIGLTAEAEDLELYRALSDHLQLSRIQFVLAEITTIGATSIASEGIATGDFALLRAADAALDDGMAQFRNFADPSYVSQLDSLAEEGTLPSTDSTDPILELQFFVNRPDTATATVEWLQQGEERLVSVHEVSSTLLEAASTTAALAATTAGEEARGFLIIAGAVFVTAIVLALFVGRSIARPLGRLTASAERLSTEELPALVESMRQGTAGPATALTPIDTRGRDEIAQLATAISGIQDVTVAVAEEQGELLQRGISDMFVNLARRNQSLLDRQIEFIDQLEEREENPDNLENLFRLDHLATRMRRNAESLLVLAGAETSRRRGQAVEIVDVVRVAMGEIEDFSRIRMLSVAPATVAGSVAVDLAHLLSELMENATQFSPPDTPVQIVGQRTEDRTYQLTVIDRGIGLSPEQMIEFNQVLASPPVVGLELGRSLGFTVVSRLAHRLGISARLASSAGGGTTATVSIPAEMTGELSSTEPVAEAPDVLHASGLAAASSEPIGLPDGTTAGGGFDLGLGQPTVADPEPAPQLFGEDPLFDLGVAGSAAEPDQRPVPTPPAATSPVSTEFASVRDVFDALESSLPAPSPETGGGSDIFASLDAITSERSAPDLPRRTRQPRTDQESPTSSPAPPPSAAATGIDPNAAEERAVTSAGLVRRRPKSPDPEPEGDASRSAVRSPEEVRQMLSRYRTGLQRGREAPDGSDQ